MRPLKLTMQGFGPYAGSETIDFNVLGNRTMFVISGKTGSGKTTIFDGISYAIYGKASGEDRNGPELRSQFAPNSLLTEVSLEFKLRNERYLIIRSPQQEKKKDRGDGFTTIGAKAELFIYDEDGEQKVIASSIREVDEKVKEIMQIDSNQFRQILMIPQGEFRKLLTSDSKEKEMILQKLFRTEMYKRIEEKLKVHSSKLKKSVELQLFRRNTALQSITSLYIEDLQTHLLDNGENDVILLPLLEKEINAMEKKLEELQKTLDDKNKRRDNVRQQLFEAESILKQLQLRDSLGEKKQELFEKQDFYQKLEDSVQLAQKADLLTKQEEICHHLKKQIDASEKEKYHLNDLIEKEKANWLGAEKQFKIEEKKEEERKKLTDHISYLKSIEKDVQLFSEKETKVKQLALILKNAEAKKRQLQGSKKENEALFLVLNEEKRQFEANKITYLENKEKLMTLHYILEKTEKYKGLAKKYSSLHTQIAEKQIIVEKIRSRFNDGKVLLETMESEWLAAQSYLLAEKLQKDEPCPVCGSTDHPRMANSAVVHITNDEDVKSARADLLQLEKEKSEAESILMTLQTQQTFLQEDQNASMEEIRKNLPDYSALNSETMNRKLESEVEALKKEQIQLMEAEKKVIKTEEEIRKIEQRLSAIQEEADKNSLEIQENSIRLAEQKTTLDSMKSMIPDYLRDVAQYIKEKDHAKVKLKRLEESYKKAQDALQETKDSLQKATIKREGTVASITRLEENMKSERAIFLESMRTQGFANYSAYTQAKLPEEESDKRMKNIRLYHEEYRSVCDRYQDLLDSLKNVKKPDIVLLKKKVEDIEKSISQVQQEYTNLMVKKRDNEDVRNQVLAINKEIKQLEEEYKLLGHLYDITRGQNTYRITFERYVLASFLDEILQAANMRLIKMTSGRYQLLRKTDRSKGNVQSGLELLVYDQYTGQERHVKTLSGGESFKAALSLALGLADVVQQYAGGVSLETMFIDEGFGTLDPESLDQAIETLMDIQSSGRLVGIISHVPEIKERMEMHLEVIAGQTGSKTAFRTLH
ncbi:AAA family ATPase [Niallia sp. 03133]|uniref:AAA family ATPase n=1 Tax=Niallia sp. 03133 TaxID=3458060 RepID=UPI004043C4D6